MENQEFITRMKEILKKAGDACGINLADWIIVSSDPDIVTDIGIDPDGYLILFDDTIPLTIRQITGVRYRYSGCNRGETWNNFIRLDLDNNQYLDCCYDEDGIGQCYNLKYRYQKRFCLTKSEVIAMLGE